MIEVIRTNSWEEEAHKHQLLDPPTAIFAVDHAGESPRRFVNSFAVPFGCREVMSDGSYISHSYAEMMGIIMGKSHEKKLLRQPGRTKLL